MSQLTNIYAYICCNGYIYIEIIQGVWQLICAYSMKVPSGILSVQYTESVCVASTEMLKCLQKRVWTSILSFSGRF